MFFKKKLHLKPNHVGYIREAISFSRLFDSHKFDSMDTYVLTEDETHYLHLGACKDCEVKIIEVGNVVRNEIETLIVMSKDHGEAFRCWEPGSNQTMRGDLDMDPNELKELIREHSDADSFAGPLHDEMRALYARVMEQHIQTDECPRHKPSLW